MYNSARRPHETAGIEQTASKIKTVTHSPVFTIMGCMSSLPTTSGHNTRASLLLRLRPNEPGREVAWEQFHDTYAPIIAGFARRLGATSSEVEDLVQGVMTAFFAASPQFAYDPSKGRFRGYLKTCVWHKLGEVRRKQGREAAALGTLATSDEASIEETWNDVWETEKLHRALAAVRQRYATNADRERTFRAFEMSTLLDRPTDVVAKELNITEESVRAAKHRVGKALREAFEQLDDTTG